MTRLITALRWYATKFRRATGYNFEMLARQKQIEAWQAAFSGMPCSEFDCLEISPGNRTTWREVGFRSYSAVEFPSFDVERDRFDRQFDVIIADNVFEHLRHPHLAGRNVRYMLRESGFFFIATPFLIRIHGHPHDYTRWTTDGLKGFLEDCGFAAEVTAWGNRRAVVANLDNWAECGYRPDFRNEPHYPVIIWAIARPQDSPLLHRHFSP